LVFGLLVRQRDVGATEGEKLKQMMMKKTKETKRERRLEARLEERKRLEVSTILLQRETIKPWKIVS
jgi:hypothetical protein